LLYNGNCWCKCLERIYIGGVDGECCVHVDGGEVEDDRTSALNQNVYGYIYIFINIYIYLGSVFDNNDNNDNDNDNNDNNENNDNNGINDNNDKNNNDNNDN